ncbi:MAG TPA: NAD(P)-dependent oxidoreductase [Lapillicoccus sp.]|nr:NAD(P)-dependent oxidoreductase [Lapillicoccus sp.]
MTDVPDQVVAVTGGSGRIGGFLREGLRRPGRRLRLLDTTAAEDPRADEDLLVGSVTDRELVARLVAGADAVVHLAGIPTEAPWADILDVNVNGSQAVLHAAAEAGVRTVVFASSNHAAGYWSRPADRSRLPDDAPPRPDSFYGWSKAAVETLGRLYSDRYGLTVVNLRIGWCSRHPATERGAEIWLSPGDVTRLVEAAMDPGVTGFHTVWGVSANTSSWWSPEGGAAIGYRPVDDSARYASELEPPEPGLPDELGGEFVANPLGRPL